MAGFQEVGGAELAHVEGGLIPIGFVVAGALVGLACAALGYMYGWMVTRN